MKVVRVAEHHGRRAYMERQMAKYCPPYSVTLVQATCVTDESIGERRDFYTY